MKDYPGKREDDEFVFCQLDDPGKPLDKGAITSFFRRLRKRINFKGKFSAYTLRHALLTRLSKNPDIAMPLLKKMAGHSKGSNIISEYQHFEDEDVLNMNLVASGKKGVKKEFALKNKPIKCPHCKISNPYDAEVCGKCNFALTQKRMINHSQLEKELNEVKLREQSTKVELERLKKGAGLLVSELKTIAQKQKSDEERFAKMIGEINAVQESIK